MEWDVSLKIYFMLLYFFNMLIGNQWLNYFQSIFLHKEEAWVGKIVYKDKYTVCFRELGKLNLPIVVRF